MTVGLTVLSEIPLADRAIAIRFDGAVDDRVGVSKHALASHERRVKRLAGRYNYSLLKAAKPFGKVLAHGGYMLRNDYTFKIVFGDIGYQYSADLDEVEVYLANLGKADKDSSDA